MDEEERKNLAEEIACAIKSTKRPWWLSWGIPTGVFGILAFLTTQIYTGITSDLGQSRETNARQNESLASIAVILEHMKEEELRQNGAIANARKDPYTGSDAQEAKDMIMSRVNRNEGRIDRLEETQQRVLIQAVEVKSKLELLESR